MNRFVVLADIRDIRSAVELPDPYFWLKIVGAVICAGVLIAWVVWFCVFRKKKELEVDLYARALDDLAKLRVKLSESEAETYTVGVSNIVRRYLGDRFGIASRRQTTEEFFDALAADAASIATIGENEDSLRAFLRECDFIKFAGVDPSVREMESLHAAARAFIEATRPQPKPEPPSVGTSVKEGEEKTTV